MGGQPIETVDKPPLVLRIATWLANPGTGVAGKPKLNMPLWWIAGSLYVFGSLMLVILFALLLSNFLPHLLSNFLPHFETLRNFLISSLILILLMRLAYIESYSEALTDCFDISEFRYRHFFPPADSPSVFRKPAAIFRFIWFASIPAMIALVSGMQLLFFATKWMLDFIF